ncbi:hypothetical protein BWQ96_10039 [Gracilariopsis chorda]|uniref:Uncharacterized protein n=1 Tax=Gracilariopsis chorda TaxID=448386 RepID=A0A2V3IDX3_9FLOR|nr:hypothetical protein BWQ96_10039 [Gracilariopsis chorda]|eukprot:PXF40252.1 hypothetical protein BWQ96_10039 [Gracilariopsis chorda]
MKWVLSFSGTHSHTLQPVSQELCEDKYNVVLGSIIKRVKTWKREQKLEDTSWCWDVLTRSLIPVQQRNNLNVVSNRLSCTGKNAGLVSYSEVQTKSEKGLTLLGPRAGIEEPHFLKEDEVDLVREPRERPPVEEFVTDDQNPFPNLFHGHDENAAAAMRMIENLEGSRKDDDAVAMVDTHRLCSEAQQSFISQVGENAA